MTCHYLPGYRSDNVGAVALGGMEKEELKGLDVSIFSRATPEVMLDTIDHLRSAQQPYPSIQKSLLKERVSRAEDGNAWCSDDGYFLNQLLPMDVIGPQGGLWRHGWLPEQHWL